MRNKIPIAITFGLLCIIGLYILFGIWGRRTEDIEPSFQKRKLVTNSSIIRKNWEYDSSFLDFVNHTSDPKGNIYSTENSDRRKLVKFNPYSGKTEWVHIASFDRTSDQLLIDGDLLFSTNAQRVSAYNSINGLLIWSSVVGTGHVDNTVQLDHSILREYYGNRIFEISQRDGKSLNNIPIGTTLWIIGDFMIQQNHSGTELTGISQRTGDQIWKKSMVPFLRDPQPQEYSKKYLIVKNVRGNFCALDLEQGGYVWCLEGETISNMIIVESQGIGYVLEGNYQLSKIDLLSGKFVDSVIFLPGEQKGNTKDSRYRYGNYLGVTADHTIILNFGDTKQLFGITWN